MNIVIIVFIQHYIYWPLSFLLMGRAIQMFPVKFYNFCLCFVKFLEFHFYVLYVNSLLCEYLVNIFFYLAQFYNLSWCVLSYAERHPLNFTSVSCAFLILFRKLLPVPVYWDIHLTLSFINFIVSDIKVWFILSRLWYTERAISLQSSQGHLLQRPSFILCGGNCWDSLDVS